MGPIVITSSLCSAILIPAPIVLLGKDIAYYYYYYYYYLFIYLFISSKKQHNIQLNGNKKDS